MKSFKIMCLLMIGELESEDDYVVQKWRIYYEIHEFNHFRILFQHCLKSNVAFHSDLFTRKTNQGTLKDWRLLGSRFSLLKVSQYKMLTRFLGSINICLIIVFELHLYEHMVIFTWDDPCPIFTREHDLRVYITL